MLFTVPRACVLAIMLSCVLTSGQAVKDAYSEYDLPSPLKNYTACGQTKRGYVCDPGNYLTPTQGENNHLIILGNNRHYVSTVRTILKGTVQGKSNLS